MLTGALAQGTDALKAFADQMERISAQSGAELTVGAGTDDAADADAIKRGQKPQTVDAMRRALGL